MINTKKDILDRINPIIDKITEVDANDNSLSVTQIRLSILSLLEDVVCYYQQHEFSLWVKDNLAIAISDVNWNITRGKPSTFMLTACLASIKKAITDEKEISHTYTHDKERAAEIEKLKPNDFIDAIKRLTPYVSVYAKD